MNLNEIEHWGNKLFSGSICCYVRQIDLLSTEELRLRGQFSTGDAEWDDGWKNSWTQVYRPISDIAEFFLNGVPVRIVHPADITHIYDVVYSFLASWKEHLRYNRVANPPVEQLLGLTEFCKAVHYWASGHRPNATMPMGGFGFFEIGRNSFDPAPYGENAAQNITDEEDARLQDMKQAFIKAVAGLG